MMKLSGFDVQTMQIYYVGRKPTEGLQSTSKILGSHEVCEVCAQLVVAVVNAVGNGLQSKPTKRSHHQIVGSNT